MNSLFKKILTGNIPVREYSTVSMNGAIRERVYLWKDKHRIDISENHWLLCLDPVIFGVWMGNNGAPGLPSGISETGVHSYRISFADSYCGEGSLEKKNLVALLDLDLFDSVV